MKGPNSSETNIALKQQANIRADHQLAGHTAIYLLARGVPGLLAFLAIPLFTRILQPSDYGRYALAIASVTLLNTFLFQGLRLSIVRYLPANRSGHTKLKSTLVTAILACLVLLGVLSGVALQFPSLRPWRHLVFGIWALSAVTALFEICCEYARATIRPWRYMFLQCVRSVAILAIGAPLVLAGFGWWGPLIGLGIGMAITIVYSYWSDWRDLQFRVDRDVLVMLCKYGLPLSMTVALTSVISTTDRFLIAGLLGTGQAGVYSVSADLASQTLTVLMMAVYLAVFPHAVRAWEEEGPEVAVRRMRYNVSLLMAVGVPCVFGLAILSPGVAHSLIGRSFRQPAEVILPVIGVGAFLAGLKSCHFDAAMQFAHHTMDQVYIVLIAAIVNILVCFLGIRWGGLYGAAVASGLVYVIAIVMTIVRGRRYVRLTFPIGAACKTVLASVIMSFVLFPFRSHLSLPALLAQVMAGGLVYAAVLIAFNFLDLRSVLSERIGSSTVASRAGIRLGWTVPDRTDDVAP